MSSLIHEVVIRCTTVPEEQPVRTNHMPIDTTLEAGPKVQVEPPRTN